MLTPGIFLVLLGLSALFAPELIFLMLGGFAISFGIILCALSLKVLGLKRKLSQFTHQIEARVILDPGKVADIKQDDIIDRKKVVLH